MSNYVTDLNIKYISNSDIEDYKDVVIPYGSIGAIVDTRTYLRWLPELKRRETPLERWQRVINYNLNLVANYHSYQWLRNEGLLMLDKFVKMQADVSGRTKWVGGTVSTLKAPEGNFNCFTRDTEFLTKLGYKTFNDFNEGDQVQVLSSFKTGKSGVWTDATVVRYPEQEIYKLTLSKGSSVQEIYTTANHRWLYRSKASNDLLETTTLDLKIGSIIPTLSKPTDLITPCNHAIQHGIVFGDGTFVKRIGNCRVDLIGHKQEFSELFTTGTIINKGSKVGEINDNITTITGLPNYWKTLPSLDSNPEYLKGFLMGWFAADGCASGCTAITSNDSKELEWFRSAMAILGQYTSKVRLMRTISPYDGSDKPLYSVCIYRDDLSEDFFINSNHKLSFEPSAKPHLWRVKSLELTDRFEEVWCVSEPKTESFTLSAGIKTRNCSATIINRLSVFGEIFGLLMNGCGVGFRLFSDDIKSLPKFSYGTEISFEEYNPLPSDLRDENTFCLCTESTLFIEVGDSKKGWIDALNYYLDVVTCDEYYVSISHVVFNLNSIRPLGERIKGFGGTASGPNALKGIIEDIHTIIQELPSETLRSIDCMDIVCAIAKGVVAGSSRRSALIALFEQGDDLMSNAKLGLYTNPELAKKSYRSQSNNTCCLTSEPTLEEIQKLLYTCRTEGEPGFNNFGKMTERRSIAAKKHRPDNPVEWYTNVLTNPCHEIILSAGKDGNSVSFCNLTTLPLPNFMKDGVLNLTEFESSIRLNTRISMRQTCVEFDNTNWTETQSDERLLGVSMTGCQDMFDMMGWKTGSEEISTFLKFANDCANDEADKYSKQISIPRPLLVTAIKPEGTASTIFGTSSGLHWDWSPYYIRRVRMTGKDALAQTLLSQGFKAYPELYDLSRIFPNVEESGWDKIKAFDKLTLSEKQEILDDCNTIVFEFPVKSNSSYTQSEVSAIEQLESLKAFTNVYTDHMPSSTISVKDHEWDDVAVWIKNNWDEYITASFFPYYGGSYPLLPLEAITEDQYNLMVSEIPDDCKTYLESGKITYNVDRDLLTRIERSLDKETDDDLGSDCQKGVCPIR